jgi:hypothetical protein
MGHTPADSPATDIQSSARRIPLKIRRLLCGFGLGVFIGISGSIFAIAHIQPEQVRSHELTAIRQAKPLNLNMVN